MKKIDVRKDRISKHLVLRRETIAQLTSGELGKIVGGELSDDQTSFFSCIKTVCGTNSDDHCGPP